MPAVCCLHGRAVHTTASPLAGLLGRSLYRISDMPQPVARAAHAHSPGVETKNLLCDTTSKRHSGMVLERTSSEHRTAHAHTCPLMTAHTHLLTHDSISSLYACTAHAHTHTCPLMTASAPCTPAQRTRTHTQQRTNDCGQRVGRHASSCCLLECGHLGLQFMYAGCAALA